MSSEHTESKRGRVRRMLIDPLREDGFRFPRGTAEEKQKAHLDRLADAVAYLSDQGLARLQQVLLTKGEGSSKCFWPCRATVLGWAEAIEHRPLSQLPELLGWFKSRAGSAALREGRLVAEFEFWHQNKRPPISDGEKRKVQRTGADYGSRFELIKERRSQGVADRHDDGQFFTWYERILATCEAWVAEGEAGRAASQKAEEGASA